MHLILPTDEQNEVINYNGNIVVVARPGSGKTYILSEIIKNILPKLLNYQGVIAISYTNKASNELMKRSSHNTDVKSSFFGTIDRFCDSEIIIPFISHFWGSSDSRVQICRIKDLPDEEKEQFAVVKENQLRLTDLETILHILKAYYKKGILFLETNGALAVYVIINSMSCRRFIKSRYTHVIIDEYQDSGIEQNELFLAIKDIGLTAIAVGDADQSIFGFSGKDSKYLLDLSKRDDFRLFPVNYNHRCHASIINYSLRLLNKNVELLKTNEIRIFEKVCTGIQTSIAAWI
jgi:superfamily I DNA/RNA helicase